MKSGWSLDSIKWAVVSEMQETETAISDMRAVLIVVDSFRETGFRNTAKNTIKMAVAVLAQWWVNCVLETSTYRNHSTGLCGTLTLTPCFHTSHTYCMPDADLNCRPELCLWGGLAIHFRGWQLARSTSRHSKQHLEFCTSYRTHVIHFNVSEDKGGQLQCQWQLHTVSHDVKRLNMQRCVESHWRLWLD